MRVLVIDDDEIFSRLLVELLEDVGIEASCSIDGLAAHEMMEHDPFDLCIIDQRMPFILGTELAEAIQQMHPHIKIILASAFADQVLKEYARRKGIFLLSKPFTRSQLLEAVHLVAHDALGKN